MSQPYEYERIDVVSCQTRPLCEKTASGAFYSEPLEATIFTCYEKRLPHLLIKTSCPWPANARDIFKSLRQQTAIGLKHFSIRELILQIWRPRTPYAAPQLKVANWGVSNRDFFRKSSPPHLPMLRLASSWDRSNHPGDSTYSK